VRERDFPDSGPTKHKSSQKKVGSVASRLQVLTQVLGFEFYFKGRRSYQRGLSRRDLHFNYHFK
jgi:hypothetical protein